MAKRNLLLCFDAFGTLFWPKAPIEQQYLDVARQSGLSHIHAHQIRDSFRLAFRKAAKLHPNYGKQSSMGPSRWWTNIIQDTFKPLVLPAGSGVPDDLAPRLLRRFASNEGYSAAPNLVGAIRALQQKQPCEASSRVYDKIVIGVITNSDDRVPVILSSFGLVVGPLRYHVAGELQTQANALNSNGDEDISFHCMSYDCGVEKPDPRIFHAAERLFSLVVREKWGIDHAADQDSQDLATSSWDKVYVGDDFDKDVQGALSAGWLPVMTCTEKQNNNDNIPLLEGFPVQPLAPLFNQHGVMQTGSLDALASWLLGTIKPRDT